MQKLPYPYNRFVELAEGDHFRVKDLLWMFLGIAVMPTFWLAELIEKVLDIPIPINRKKKVR